MSRVILGRVMDERDKLERVNQRLNDRSEEGISTPIRHELEQPKPAAAQGWKDDDRPTPASFQKRKSLLNKLLVGAAIAFVLAAALAIYLWNRDLSAVDADKIRADVVVPAEIEATKPFEIDVALTNQNSEPITNATLVAHYPVGSSPGLGESKDFWEKDLGFIAPGQIQRISVPAVLYGAAKEKREIEFSLTYSLNDSQTSFAKDFSEEITITSSPLSIAVRVPDKITVGESLPVRFDLQSSSPEKLTGLKLEVVLPSDSSIENPEPAQNSSRQWRIDELAPGSRLSFSGDLYVGSSDYDPLNLTVRLISSEGSVLLEERREIDVVTPPLLLELDQTTSGSLIPGREVRFRLSWSNEIDAPLQDIVIEASIAGAFDPTSVSVSNGIFNQGSQTIQWTPENINKLGELNRGENGSTEFKLILASGENLEINVQARGKNLKSGSTATQQLGQLQASLPLESSVDFNGHALYRSGSRTNSGPLPPQVGETTTYTVVMSVTEKTSGKKVEKITSRLGSGVSVDQDSLPRDVSFDQSENMVIWIPQNDEDTTTFGVSLTPSSSQLGNPATLLGDIRLYIALSLENRTIELGTTDITTDLSQDTGYDPDEGIVASGS